MSNYKLKVPITTYQDIKLAPQDLIECLKQEQKFLIRPWDNIVRKGTKSLYHNQGYGSHDIGEEDGPEVEPVVLENYLMLEKTIVYLRHKNTE
jgi:hypothetical protein